MGNDSVTVIERLVGFIANSDRKRQENFQPVRGEEVLRKIRDLSLPPNTSTSTDIEGILMIAVQALETSLIIQDCDGAG